MKKSGFVEGTVIATAAIVITKIMGILYVIPFYQMVGSLGSALYAYGYNIYSIFLDISTAGIPLALSKIIKEYNTLGLMDAKKRALQIGIKIVSVISIVIFLVLIVFAKPIATMIIGDLTGGNSISDVAFVIRCVSLAILVVPFLSVFRGYLQGHNIMNVSAVSQVIEQVFRIIVILGGVYLATYIFKLPLANVIGIAVLGAFVGGIAAILYVAIKTNKNKEELNLVNIEKKDDVSNKEIGKKIISYAIPFIIITLAFSLNNFIDMVMILRTLEYLGIDTATVEFATTSITTWSTKISMIVNSVATGLITSLIPTIVGAFTRKNWQEVENKFNKALQLILVVCTPMCIGLSLLSRSVWSVFYGDSLIGSRILSIQIIVSLFYNLFLVTNSVLHGLNKSKTVYRNVLIGLGTNVLLNVPLMVLFYKLGLAPYIGAIISTLIGYVVSFTITLKGLQKEHNIHYTDTLQVLIKILVPLISMIIVVVLLKMIIPLNIGSKTSCIIYIAIISIIGAVVYLGISYKMKIIDYVFGEDFVNKIKKKLTFRKAS